MNISSSWLRTFLSGESDEPLVISTTGTSGNVKKIEIPRQALLATSKAANKFLGAKPGEIWSLLLPTNHIAGINVLTRAFLLGTEVVSVKDHANYSAIVPTQLFSALNGDDELLTHLKTCKKVLIGGAKLSEALLKQGQEAGINIVTSYGATETCGGCVFDGTPLEGVEIQINNGLIEVRIAGLNSGNWISLKDLGEIKDGKLIVQGRADDVFISGGENLSLNLVEDFLQNTYPSQKIYPLSIPDTKWGEALAIISDEEFPTTLDHDIAENLGKLYIPKYRKIVAQIPLIGIGKLDRNSLSKLFLENE